MKKLSIIILSMMLLFILAGCKVDSPGKVSTVTQATSTGTSIPTKTGEKIEDSNIKLLPGLKDWKASDDVRALNQVLMLQKLYFGNNLYRTGIWSR